MEGRLGADVRREDSSENERKEGVDVHAELDGGEVIAGEEREKAVEARHFVEQEGKRD